MNDVYSEIRVVTLPSFRIAKYAAVGKEPEADANAFMDDWAQRNGLLSSAECKPRRIGWDYPVTKEQYEQQGVHGYVSAYVLPDGFDPLPDDKVEIVDVGTDTYATLTVTDPFSAPWERIPTGYHNLLNNQQFKTLAWEDRIPDSWDGRIAFEEAYKRDGTEYMDIFIPIIAK